jgi:hypothetical protein
MYPLGDFPSIDYSRYSRLARKIGIGTRRPDEGHNPRNGKKDTGSSFSIQGVAEQVCDLPVEVEKHGRYFHRYLQKP